MRQIVDIQFARFAGRLLERGITVDLTDSGRDHLATVGYDSDYGARPLKRRMQSDIEGPIAMAILQDRFGPGDHITIEGGNNGFSFN